MSTRPLVGAISPICWRSAFMGMLSPTISAGDDLPLELAVLGAQPPRLGGVLHHDQGLFERQRLFQKVVGAQLGGPHRGLDRAVAGDHHDLGTVLQIP